MENLIPTPKIKSTTWRVWALISGLSTDTGDDTVDKSGIVSAAAFRTPGPFDRGPDEKRNFFTRKRHKTNVIHVIII